MDLSEFVPKFVKSVFVFYLFIHGMFSSILFFFFFLVF
ncbi:unnamed protein product [Arabidopsis halleri]